MVTKASDSATAHDQFKSASSAITAAKLETAEALETNAATSVHTAQGKEETHKWELKTRMCPDCADCGLKFDDAA